MQPRRSRTLATAKEQDMASDPQNDPSLTQSVDGESPDSHKGPAQLARSWDQAAAGYDDYFSPRFAPWIDAAVAALPADLPPGALAVPCCGTGHELLALAARFPGRALVGIDLSAGMLARAAERTRHLPGVSLRVADASDASGWPACAAVVSLFGLQQLADPPSGLRSWMEALVPGGVLSVIFWPKIVETEGPFAWFRAAVLRLMPLPHTTWEGELVDAIALAGGRLHDDCEIAHTMTHESAAQFLAAILDSGPGRVLVEKQGLAWSERLRQEFLASAPSGPIAHAPCARHLVARR
jgi:SAM-dependent methyltransferase